MELPRRKGTDVYLPDGALGRAVSDLRECRDAHDLRIAIIYAFDFRTRMLPYWYADKRMAPCSVRTLGDALHACGFRHLRIVLQQWTPNFKPSAALLDERPLDIMLVSAMQVHAEPSYDLIRDAHRLGDRRPLILAGGPKAIYEPADYFELGPEPGIGADCVVTGEAYVLLDLLRGIFQHEPGRTPREGFERARRQGTLRRIPGLVYLSPDGGRRPIAHNTGIQRLLRDLDEMPMPDAGFRLLEPPHRRPTLRPEPYPAAKVHKQSPIASLISTQGCKFNCPYCPIPAVNQRTWRHKSPQRLAAEIKHLYEAFGIRSFFGTDDNFFNHRETVVELMGELARTRIGGRPLGDSIRFYTEATEFDVHKNRDLLPLCRRGGMRGIWFGIEDVTAELVNKGQNAGKTADLFATLSRLGIQPMAMMIHSDAQPLRSKPGDLSGLVNQARYVLSQGAVSYQCTYLAPAVGTRDFETTARARAIFEKVGERPIPQAYFDGNHVVASRHPQPWDRQVNVLRAYATFYNPLNTIRAILKLRADAVATRRLLFQVVGQIGLVLTVPKLLRWARRLKRGPIQPWDGLVPARIPMVDVHSRREIDWAVKHLPSVIESPADVSRPSAGFPESSTRMPEVALPILNTAWAPQ